MEHGLRWEEDFEMALIETGREGMNCICPVQDKSLCQTCVNTLIKFCIS